MSPTTKPLKQAVLVDAMVVIHAHERGYWQHLCSSYTIALAATVLEEELFYFHTSGERRQSLRPRDWIMKGMVVRMEASMADYHQLTERLSENMMLALDPGETESLAILLSKQAQHTAFSSADGAAIKALGVLGMGHRAMSVEQLVTKLSVKLPKHFSTRWLNHKVAEGTTEQHLWLKSISPKAIAC